MPTELETATTMYSAYLAAELALVGGAQSYSIGTRSVTKANLSEIVRERKNWENKKKGLEGGGIRGRRIVHRDI